MTENMLTGSCDLGHLTRGCLEAPRISGKPSQLTHEAVARTSAARTAKSIQDDRDIYIFLHDSICVPLQL